MAVSNKGYKFNYSRIIQTVKLRFSLEAFGNGHQAIATIYYIT